MEYQRIYAKIDLDALEFNLSQIKNSLPQGVKLMPIIKADAYGHGAVEIAKFLEGKCDAFGVSVIEEATELRRAGITAPILLLGYTSPEQYDAAVEHDVRLTVFELFDAKRLNDTAARHHKSAKIHIAVDTGMSRIGFQVTDAAADAAAEIFNLPNIKVEGMFSHYATADEADKTYAREQKKLFDRFAEMLFERGCSVELMHLNNSAGIMEFSDSYYDMVRAGIILYGLYPSDETANESFPLRPVMELITHISRVSELPAGRGISYGRTFVTDRPTMVATVPVGYADGYPRALSNRGYVLIGGTKCPILGRICMDQMMVDVTEVSDAKVGDNVVLIGQELDTRISVEEISALASSFNYEFVCKIGRRVPKVYFRHGKPHKTVSYLEH